MNHWKLAILVYKTRKHQSNQEVLSTLVVDDRSYILPATLATFIIICNLASGLLQLLSFLKEKLVALSFAHTLVLSLHAGSQV